MGKLAITGGRPAFKRKVPAWPHYNREEEKALLSVLRSRNWGGYPFPNTHAQQFAEQFAAAHDARYGIPVANGTISIEIALKAAGVLPGDEVIVPAATFAATATAPLFTNAVPVFVDIDAETYTLDVKKMRAALTPRTRFIIPVHFGMQLADLDGVLEVAAEHGLQVIEDCAHSHGGQWRGKGCGSYGLAGSFSFQSSKLMTAGEGGIIITSDEDFAGRCETLANCGRAPVHGSYSPMAGNNYRMTEFQAAILLCQLKRLRAQTERRERNGALLTARLEKLPGLRTLRRDERTTRKPIFRYVFRFMEDEHEGVSRDRFVEALLAEGVPAAGLFYEPVYQSPLFNVAPETYPYAASRIEEYKSLSCPVAERAMYHEMVSLPNHLLLGSRQDTEAMASAVEKVLENIDELASPRPESSERVKETPLRSKRQHG